MATTAGSTPRRDDVLAATQSQRGSQYVKEEEQEAIRVGSYIKIFVHSPVAVTTLNKALCSTAFSISIAYMVGVITALSMFYVNHRDVLEHPYFFGPVIVVYVILVIDIISGFVGIWTCLAEAGTRRQKAMIYVCIWLLLSSLLHVCAGATLYMNTEFKTLPQQEPSTAVLTNPSSIPCSKADADNVDCRNASELTVIIECSCIIIFLEILTILLCRLNYPQVFNWLVNKQVLLDEEIVDSAIQTYRDIGSLGAAFFTPCDIERLAARGSLNGTDVVTLTASRTILVQRKSKDVGRGRR